MNNIITSPTFASQDSHTSLVLAPAPPAPLAPPTLSISLPPSTVPAPPAQSSPLAPLVPLVPLVPLAPLALPGPPIVSQREYVRGVIKKETQRRSIVELGFQLQELQERALHAGEKIPSPDPTNIPIEWFAPFAGNAQLYLTPMERFCVPNLTDDADSVYGRIQWGVEKNPPLSLNARQQHSDHLKLRVHEVVPVETQQLHIRPSQLENGKKATMDRSDK